MLIIRNHEITPIETPGGNFTSGLATPSRGAQEVNVIRQHETPSGHNPPHRHDREEVMVMLTGTVTVTVDAVEETLRPGDTLIVPAQALHQIANTGHEPAEWLIIAPQGRRFFSASGEEALPTWAQ